MNFILEKLNPLKAFSNFALWSGITCLAILDIFLSGKIPFTWVYLPVILFALLNKNFNIKPVLLVVSAIILLPLAYLFTVNLRITEIIPIVLSRSVVMGTVIGLVIAYKREKNHSLELARSDPLTGITNHPMFMEVIESELERSRRKERSLTLVYIDCDNFSQLNESQGHPLGDEVLKAVAKSLKYSIRKYDAVGRVGGDEFCLLFPETNSQQSRAIAERVHSEMKHCMLENHWDVTFSVGVVTFHQIPESANDAVTAVDRIMYQVKNSGKNGIQYETIEAPTLPADRLISPESTNVK